MRARLILFAVFLWSVAYLIISEDSISLDQCLKLSSALAEMKREVKQMQQKMEQQKRRLQEQIRNQRQDLRRKQQKEELKMKQQAVCLGLSLLPFAGGACDIAVGVKNRDLGIIVSGTFFLALDAMTFGAGHYYFTGAQGVTTLARSIQRGGKIAKAIDVGWISTKSLRLAAQTLKDTQTIFVGSLGTRLFVLLNKFTKPEQREQQRQSMIGQPEINYNAVLELISLIKQIEREEQICKRIYAL